MLTKLYLALVMTLTLVTVAAAIALMPGESGTLNCLGDELAISQETITTAAYSCIAYTLTPTPTPTLTPTVTPTPVPVDPYAAAPLCAQHDPTAYHGLWSSAGGCHYDHTHFIDPTAPEVTAIFGDYTEYTGQEVSYPWQTFMGASPGYPMPPSDPAYENAHKHEGYKFDFYDLAEYGTCPVAFQGVQAVPNAWLIERHSRGDKHDFLVRVHSFWAMVRFCIPGTSEVAYLYTGGWQDFGQRISPYQGTLIPLADNPQPSYNTARQPYIAHGCINSSQCNNNPGDSTWVSESQMLQGHYLFGFGFRGNDAFDAIDATNGLNNPNPTFVYLCANADGSYNPVGCINNNTRSHTFQVTGNIPSAHDLLDGIADGRVNYEGYTDRWGVIVQGCTQPGLDCVPVRMVNLPVGVYTVNLPMYDAERFLPAHHNDTLPDYDLYFSGEPSGWVGPNN